MASMSVLRSRAEQLLSLGLTPNRAFRVLRSEFRDAERDQLHRVLPLQGAPKGVTPGWALWGQPLRPTQIRFKQQGAPREVPVKIRTVGGPEPEKKAPTRKQARIATAVAIINELLDKEVDDMLAPTITVSMREVVGGDWIKGAGEVLACMALKKDKHLVVFESGESTIYPSDTQVDVRLEDGGEEDVDG